MRLSTKKLENFKTWLSAQGSELLPLTNEFELVRFRCPLGTGVVYQGKKGNSYSSLFVHKAIDCFLNRKKWEGKGKPGKRIHGSKRKRELFDRDGDECFYCGKTMPPDDMTKEHLFSITQGGKDHINNMVLAHEKCNDDAGHLPVIEKIKLRDRMRNNND